MLCRCMAIPCWLSYANQGLQLCLQENMQAVAKTMACKVFLHSNLCTPQRASAFASASSAKACSNLIMVHGECPKARNKSFGFCFGERLWHELHANSCTLLAAGGGCQR